MSDATARCPRCGDVLPSSDPSVPCPRCAAASPAIETWFEEPEPPPPLPKPAEPELVILDEPEADEVPVVHPARVESLPEARPRPEPRSAPEHRPSIFPTRPSSRAEAPIEKPKPQIGLAMIVILLLTVATCGGSFVIAYAIWAGFKRFTPKRAEVPADVRPAFPFKVAPAAR